MIPRLLALLAAAAALLAATSATAAARVPLEVGVADDSVLHGDPGRADATVAEWQRMGVDTVRLQVVWSRVAPTPESPLAPPFFSGANPDDPQYNWGQIDQAVARITRAGIKPLLMLDGPPPLWASSNPALGNRRWHPSAYHFGQFAQAVATRYGAVVDEYILWNEPNLPVWIQPQASCKVKLKTTTVRVGGKSRKKKTRTRTCTPMSPHIVRFMVRAAYPAMKTVDPQSTILAGATSPTGANLRSRNADMRPLQWWRAFGCVDGRLRRVSPKKDPGCSGFQPATIDGVAHHPHSTKHPPDEGYQGADNVALAHLSKLERVVDGMQQRGRLIGTSPKLGFWLDEYAYQTNPPDKLRGVTPGRQDRYMQQAAYQVWRNPRVRMLAQYGWIDEPVGPAPRYTGWQSGVISANGKPKRSYASFDDPLWLDLKRNSIWGQVRPGTQHDVTIEMRQAGASTQWQQVGSARTAHDGSFYVKFGTPIVPFASYRVRYGDRTSGVMVATPPNADEEGGSLGDVAEVRTAATAGTLPVPRNFAGFSMEWNSIGDYVGVGGRINPVFATLVRTLARAGSGAPTLRFGGESTDHTWWNPNGVPKPLAIVNDITPGWVDHLRAWVAATGTPVVPGINMGMNDPARAAELAGALKAGLPARAISAFELGNEPDLYGTPRTYTVGRNTRVRGQKRPTEYDFEQYEREAAAHAAEIARAAPGVPLTGGAFASGAWEENVDELLDRNRSIREYSTHAYPLPTCDPAVRKRGKGLIPRILAPSAYSSIVARMRHVAGVAQTFGASVRVSEINSAICGGVRGVSDSFAASLWGADILFGLASAGIKNVDFHTWTGSNYGPIEFSHADGRTSAHVRPLFLGMLLFNRATPAGSRLLPIGPNPAGGEVKTWATVDRRGTRRVVVINKDLNAHHTLVLRVPGAGRRATVQRLLAPTMESSSKATLAGQGYGARTRDGALKGRFRTQRLNRRSGAFRIRMRTGSAALLEIPAG